MSRRLLRAIAVAAIAVAAHASSLGNGFALDDTAIVETNPDVHGISRIWDAVSGPYWPGAVRDRGLYRPLTLATYTVDWTLGGGRPWPFHLANVLLHAAVSVLVLLLLGRLGAPPSAALAGAAVFAVHPVHVEAVANVVGRAELLAALFFLGACLVYLRDRHGRWSTALAAGGLFLAALLAKEHAITLPAALVLLDGLRGRARGVGAGPGEAGLPAGLGRRWRVFAVLATAAVGYLVLRRAVLGVFLGTETPPWFWGLPARARLLTSIRVWPEYLRLMVWPADLVPDYGPGVIVPVTRMSDPLLLAGVATGALLALVLWRARHALPLLAGGIAWLGVTVLPVSGLLFAVGVILAERTLYLPSVGLAFAVAALAGAALHRPVPVRKAVAVGGVLVLVAAGARTWAGGRVWRDSSTVLYHLADRHPASYRSQWSLGNRLAQQGDTVAALQHLELAARMVPGYHNLRVDFARLLRATGQPDRALAQLDTALLVIPGGTGAHVERVRTLLDADRPRAAAAAARQGLAWQPDHPVLTSLLEQAVQRSHGVPDQ